MLRVPTQPLQNLTKPWVLMPGCDMRNPSEQVFLQAVILTKGGQLYEYSPLVVNSGTNPAISPVPYDTPVGSVVAIWGGGNNVNTVLIGDGASSCVNGANGRVFGQVFYCGARAFFGRANDTFRSNESLDTSERKLDTTNGPQVSHGRSVASIPFPGRDVLGNVCPTTRSFDIVDQDPSDNVQTRYLVMPDGSTAQDTAQNRSILNGYSIAVNGSDNTLLTRFVDPAIGCQPFNIPSIEDGGVLVPTQATDELQAAYYQRPPVALIPPGDPMVGPNIPAMVSAYRIGVDQPTRGHLSTRSFCAHIMKIAPKFFSDYASFLSASPSPDPAMNLHDFLVARYQATLTLLTPACQ